MLPPEKIELLAHRCLVRTARPHHDRWSFDNTYEAPRPASFG